MATATTRSEKKSKQSPLHKIRVGATVATIWANEGENGTWYNTTVVRVYKDECDEYVETSSFGESQLLELSAAASMASQWIVMRHAEDRAKEREAGSR